MSEKKVKIRLKTEDLEFEYEGCDSFLKDDLSNFLKNTFDSCAKHSVTLPTSAPEDLKVAEDSAQKNFTTATIATRISAKSGPELALAAAAYLTIVGKKEEFSRGDLLGAMKTAKSFYSTNMSSNLSSILRSLVSKRILNETAVETYALTVTARQNVEKSIAQ